MTRYFWVALHKATGEIAEQSKPYDSSDEALKEGLKFVRETWTLYPGKAIVEVYTEPRHYSDYLKGAPLARETLAIGDNPEGYVTIADPGKTTFKVGELISREAFEKENERVRKLGEKPATGIVAGKGSAENQNRMNNSSSETPFIKVGDRVRYLGLRSRYGHFPEGAWMEYGIEGTVVKYHEGLPAVTTKGEYFEPLLPWATVRWANGGETAIDAESEGKRWKRL